MKHSILYLVLLLSLFSQLTVAKAEEIASQDNKKVQTAYMNQQILSTPVKNKSNMINESFNTIMPEMEFETVKLEKGRSFVVVSEQNLNNNILEGTPIKFESVQKEYLAYDKIPTKVVFQGTVEKTGKPRLAGKGGTVKIKLEKITIDKITYPVEALISKIDNKKVYFNTLSAAPCYLANLANAADNGVIHSSLKDPCGSEMCTTQKVYAKPLVFLGAAALQAADLLLLPFSALGRRGADVDIPLNTYFEIKMNKDLYVLNI